MQNKYPYTDFHELNLDWFLEEFKKVSDHMDDLQENVDDFEERTTNRVNGLDQTVQDFINFVNNYFDNLDVQEEINNKLDAWLADGTIAEVLGESLYYTVPEFFGAVGDGVTDDTNAIINAFNYCKTHNVILKSYNKSYKTTSNCVLDFGNYSFDVELNGYFDYLEFIANSSRTLSNKIYVKSADVVKLVNSKTARFTGGEITNFYLLADRTNDASGSSAYNDIYGDYFENIELNSVGAGAWVNENRFYGIRTKTLTINSASYRHNNNRFYDMTLEGGTINLYSCQSNYIRLRGEDGYTLNSDNSAYNNIIEKTWQSNEYGNIRIDKIDEITQTSNINTSEMYKYFHFEPIANLNVYNVYNDANDYANETFRLKGNQRILEFKAPADNSYIINANTNTEVFRGYAYVLDDQGNIIDYDSLTDFMAGTGYTKDSNNRWRQTTDQDKISIALKNLNRSDYTFVFFITVSGGTTEDLKYLNARYGFVGKNKMMVRNYYRCLENSTIPTNTDAPLGTYVQDSTGTTKGWVLTSSGWAALT